MQLGGKHCNQCTTCNASNGPIRFNLLKRDSCRVRRSVVCDTVCVCSMQAAATGQHCAGSEHNMPPGSKSLPTGVTFAL